MRRQIQRYVLHRVPVGGSGRPMLVMHEGLALDPIGFRPRLDEIDVPTLVVSGPDDWLLPPKHAGAGVNARGDGR